MADIFEMLQHGEDKNKENTTPETSQFPPIDWAKVEQQITLTPPKETRPGFDFKGLLQEVDRREGKGQLTESFHTPCISTPEASTETSVKKAYRAALRQQAAYSAIVG